MAESQRLKFSQVLKTALGSTTEVYFQPPPDLKMKYPCLVYERDDLAVKHADNVPYNTLQAYQVTHISYDPDSDVVDKLMALPLCSYNRHFATSGLNHDVFVIYHQEEQA